MLRLSPFRSSRSTPRKTSIRFSPLRNDLRTFSACRTISLISKRLRRLHQGRPHSRDQPRNRRNQNRTGGDHDKISFRIMNRNLRKLIKAHQRLFALGHSGKRINDIISKIKNSESGENPENRSRNSEQKTLKTERRRNLPGLPAESAEQTDLFRFPNNSDQQRTGDRKCGDQNNEKKQKKEHIFLEPKNKKKFPVRIEPRFRDKLRRKFRIQLPRRPICIVSFLKANRNRVHTLFQSIKILHQTKRADHRVFIDLMPAAVENPDHFEFPGKQNLISLQSLQHQRRINFDNRSDPRTEISRQPGTQKNRIIIEIIEFAHHEKILDRNHLLLRIESDTSDKRKRRTLPALNHHKTVRVRRRLQNLRMLPHDLQRFGNIIDHIARPRRFDLQMPARIDDFSANLFAKSIHHALDNDQNHHPEHDAAGRNNREKRNRSARR